MRAATLSPETAGNSLSFELTDVTGTKTLQVSGVEGHRLAGELAGSMASVLGLPANAPYYLRHEQTARKLADDAEIAGQIPPSGATLMVVPSVRLG
jgi:hypothetical protein